MDGVKADVQSTRQNGCLVQKLRFPLYAQVLVAICFGVLVGSFLPGLATNHWVKCLGTGFVKLIKMAIGPIIFCTIVSGIAHVADAAKIGRVAIKAIVYFELVSTFALAIGLLVANLVQPGVGFSGKSNGAAVEKYRKQAEEHSAEDFVLNIIPKTLISGFSEGEILQVLFVSVLFGFALMKQGDRAKSVHQLVDEAAHVMFGIVAIVMKAAPIGAFGAMAFTVGTYGVGALGSLVGLVATFYMTAIAFVILVLGVVAAIARFNIFRFLFYIRSELLLVVATSSSESALPSLMTKLENLGCAKAVVGLVVPLGYSFNLDGTNIYMTLATLFISQAMGVSLSFGEQMQVLAVAMLTSKGATGVTGAGFITLAATLGSIRPELVPGMALLIGIDKFMSECRALTNIVGNGVATVVVSALEGELDREMLDSMLSGAGTEKDPVKAGGEENSNLPDSDLESGSAPGGSDDAGSASDRRLVAV
jgi:aerobic C4-dicarboxylate transport protein